MTNFSTVKNQLWKDAVDDRDSVTVKVNWQDFNPNFWSHWSWSYTNQSDVYVWSQTTSFDLSGMQNWHEVCVALRMYENDSWSTQTNSMAIRWEKSTDWWSTYSLIYLYDYGSRTLSDSYWEFFYSYIGIDWDEIWDDTTYYRVRFLQNWAVSHTINFTTSNISINSTLRNAWYMWVEWSYLHYIDWSKWNWKWYEHKIDVDSSYSSYVWTDHKWYIRLDDSGSYNRRIYYIDENWYKKRTYEADNRYWWATSVWTNSKWYMRTPWIVSASNWYAYNCFIWNNWYKYRIMNWPTR